MIKAHIKYNGNKIPIELPTSKKDVPIKMYSRLLEYYRTNENKKELEFIASLTNVHIDILKNVDEKYYKLIYQNITWLDEKYFQWIDNKKWNGETVFVNGLEYKVQKHLKEGIALCEAEYDYVTREMLVEQLKDTEEDHAHWLEQQLRLIDMIGLPNYLQTQMAEVTPNLV